MESLAETMQSAFEINHEDRPKHMQNLKPMIVYYNEDTKQYDIWPDNYEVVASYEDPSQVLAFIHGFNVAREFHEYFENRFEHE